MSRFTVKLHCLIKDLQEGDWFLDSDGDPNYVDKVSPRGVHSLYWNKSLLGAVQKAYYDLDKCPTHSGDLKRVGLDLQQEVEVIKAAKTLPVPPKFSSIEEAEAWLEAHT